MSYCAYTGIEYREGTEWKCLVENIPMSTKKLHYAFDAVSGMSFVNVDDFDDSDHNFSPEITKRIKGTTEVYPVLGSMSFNKLCEIRDRTLEEIKTRKHYYKTPAEALDEWIDREKDKGEEAVKIVAEIFKQSNDDLKVKGFLNDPYAEDDYAELEYYLFAFQSVIGIICNYIEEASLKLGKLINTDDVRIVMWGM